jgi:hypothetical protein
MRWLRLNGEEMRNANSHCCETMRSVVEHQCAQHAAPDDCPDVVVIYSPTFDEYGIPIRDGGSSVHGIQFCRWCGTRLPTSKRDLWFDTLAKLGFDGPLSQDIPVEYRSDAWWRRRLL